MTARRLEDNPPGGRIFLLLSLIHEQQAIAFASAAATVTSWPYDDNGTRVGGSKCSGGNQQLRLGAVAFCAMTQQLHGLNLRTYKFYDIGTLASVHPPVDR